ncbi:UvrB/UvrC motif-containing protein [Neomoorella carbonis]|uniref:UvrB/UvrC motif-containing protein n=1 Tax=Neomoorella carbonis TaxID=3062783 RepID=UPI003253D44E
MLCERCQERPASVHVTRIINGDKTELYLCQECAREMQPQLNFSIPKFLAGLLDYDPGLEVKAPPAVERCRECGLSYEQFHQTGRLGCPDCYHYLAARLDPLIRRIQGSSQHRGKVPRRAGGNLRVRREIEKLRAQLQQLVEQEEFEKAAQVRDRIRDLENRLGEQGGWQ